MRQVLAMFSRPPPSSEASDRPYSRRSPAGHAGEAHDPENNVVVLTHWRIFELSDLALRVRAMLPATTAPRGMSAARSTYSIRRPVGP